MEEDSPLLSVMATSVVRSATPPAAPEGAVWADTGRPVDERVAALVAELSLREKSELLYGRGLKFSPERDAWQAWVKGNDRLGIPDVTQGDSPAAPLVGPSDTSQIPSEHALGASFDPAVARSAARVLGAQVRRLGYGVWHAPTLDVTRDPRHGRAHENFGEDGFLSSVVGEAYARGIQDERVVADLKHFGLNTVETDRLVTDCIVDDDRAVGHYLAPFRSVLHNMDIAMIMTSYAKVNGSHINDVPRWFELLRDEWGFDGIARNDAMAGHSLASLELGLDQEFRDELHFGETLIAAVTAGEMSESVVDRAVTRILATMMRSGLFDDVAVPSGWNGPFAEEVDAIRHAAASGVVLLRNVDDVLPLAGEAGQTVAVLGTAAVDRAISGGPTRPLEGRDTFAEAFAERFPEATVEVVAAVDGIGPNDLLPGLTRIPTSSFGTPDDPGLDVVFFDADGNEIERRANAPLSFELTEWALGGIGREAHAPAGTARAVWTGTWTTAAGEHRLDVATGGALELTIDDELVLSHDGDAHRTALTATTREFAEGVHRLRAEYTAPDESRRAFVDSSAAPMKVGVAAPAAAMAPGIRDAVEAARRADVAIVVVRDLASEGSDRVTLRLPGQQDELISAVAAVNERTIVVLQTASAVLTPWREEVAAIVQGWYGGSRGNAGILAVLAGDRDAGGRLPVTFPDRDEDLPTFAPERFPGVERVVRFDEPETGYRYFGGPDAPEPAFPFGFGLSYTSWQLSGLSAPDRVTITASAAESARRDDLVPVTVTVHNTGGRDGICVPQLYVRTPSGTVAHLKAFASLGVSAGATTTADLSVACADLAVYRAGSWSIEEGSYELMVGTSSRDAVLSTVVEVAVR